MTTAVHYVYILARRLNTQSIDMRWSQLTIDVLTSSSTVEIPLAKWDC